MLRRAAALLALFTLFAPALGRANDWEENYEDLGRDEAPQDDYRVSVDMGVSGSVDIDSFQDALQPYGDWMVSLNYGRVFRPHVSREWRPYYYGRWEWTSEGWLWVSDEPFGWAAYHYGRWAYDSYQGWLWVPGYQWAPAWVSWRYSSDVVGWAPLSPGVSVFASATPFQEAFWTFVPCQSFVGYPVRSVAFAPSYSRRYFEGSAPAPARPGPRDFPGRSAAAPAWGGPPPRAIEQRIGRPINPVRVVAAQGPGAGQVAPGEVAIFRPELNGRSALGRKDGATRSPAAQLNGSRPSPSPAAPRLIEERPTPGAWGKGSPSGALAPHARAFPAGEGTAPVARSPMAPPAQASPMFRAAPGRPAAPTLRLEPGPSAGSSPERPQPAGAGRRGHF